MEKVRKEHSGLSPSSLTLFQSCARKYYLSKIVKTPIDKDASRDSDATNIGKAFHKVLEDTKHEVEGLKYVKIQETVKSFDLDDSYSPMIFAMLKKYSVVHRKSGLKAIACEIEIETVSFYGFIDVILQDSHGGWWIGDMKTASSYTPNLIPTLPSHPQLNLYAKHVNYISQLLGIDEGKYLGCRYLLTTKSKLVPKKDETLQNYINRLTGAIKSIDFIVSKELMNPELIVATHDKVFNALQEMPYNDEYLPNYGSCLDYHRPCEYWSKCHGKTFSEMGSLHYIDGEE